MGLFDFIKGRFGTTVEVQSASQIAMYSMSFANKIQNYSNESAYSIATSLPEVFIPIDIIASRVSSVNFQLVDKNDNPIENIPSNLKRLLIKPNIYSTLKDLVYLIQFSKLAHGGAYVYPVFSTKTKNSDLLQYVYGIEPNKIVPNLKRTIPSNTFLIDDVSELVDYYDVQHFRNVKIQSEDIITWMDGFFESGVTPLSPLNKSKKPINNLFAVYSARYKNYVHNGNAGILTRKVPNDGMSQVADNDEIRQEIIKQMTDTEGIVGDKNFIGISSHDLNFIKTLATISELEPFKESETDLITIGASFGIDKDLLPRVGGTTFTNKEQAEVNLWQNIIIAKSQDMALFLNDIFYLDTDKMRFKPDFSMIQILQDDREKEIKSDLLEIEKIEKLKSLNVDVDKFLEKWRN